MDQPLHRLHAQLQELGITGPDRLEPFHPRVRDRDDIDVHRCPNSGVVLLGRIDHVDKTFYLEKDHPGLKEHGTRHALTASLREDTTRRVNRFGALLANRDWLDVGTGPGALLDATRDVETARSVCAVEPQEQLRSLLAAQGYTVHSDISSVPSDSVDVVTLFHVFEHIPDPVDHLGEVRRVLRPGGTVILEVPHARDFLLSYLDLEAFRRFTLWSEHLVLHTRSSLRRLLEACGFERVTIEGVQRYPLANHLHWLATGLPGGHQTWHELREADLDRAYAARLAALDATDTLMAFATRSA